MSAGHGPGGGGEEGGDSQPKVNPMLPRRPQLTRAVAVCLDISVGLSLTVEPLLDH